MEKFSLESIWNDTLAKPKRLPKERDYIYASEMGKPFYERWLSMKGTTPSNPLEARVLRKMATGLWFEDMIGYILEQIGILQEKQFEAKMPETKDLIAVSGRGDYIAGGISNWNEARERVKNAHFPEFVEEVSLKLVDYFEQKHPKGLMSIPYEIKSVNSQVFWAKKDYLEEAYPHHTLQLYTYLKALDLKGEKYPLGRLMYISKDDLTIKEMDINYPDERLEKIWNDDRQQMSDYWLKQEQPPLPDMIVFDKRGKINFQVNKIKYQIIGCYKDNWMVKWSQYLTEMTGFKTEDDWLDALKPELKLKNDDIKEKYIFDHKLKEIK